MQPALTVAILAGGAASRLGGRDKGLQMLGAKPLIAWVVDYCMTSINADRLHSVDLLIIANRNLEDYARYARVHADVEPGFRGPLAGVASALEAAIATRVLTLPVDSPEPPSDLAARLGAVLARKRAAVAHDGERRQPLFAMYRRELAGSAAKAAAEGRGVHEWQDAVRAVEVDFSDSRRHFHNLNTPDEFAAYPDVLRPRN